MTREAELTHWQLDESMDYYKKQYMEPKRSTVAFESFLKSHTDISGNILDLACGGVP